VISPRRALRAWWQARLKPVDHWTLTQRNVYILPTRAGLAFGFTLLLLLLASINYQLNLGYALTFLLAGSALASMHMTHHGLRGLDLHLKPPPPAFSGGPVQLDLVVANPGSKRHGLGFGLDGSPDRAWADLPAQSQSTVQLALVAGPRGRQSLPLLQIESRFPFGLFRAWSVWRPAGEFWVYPAAEPDPPAMPTGLARHDGRRQGQKAQGGEFDGLRPYRRGDGPRQVVWKKVARTGELVSREQVESLQTEIWLDWSATPAGVDPERRLSRLCAWVLAAQAHALPFGMRLPGLKLPTDQGGDHTRRALQALAEWG
jgi:uncharacterized protein (DUF58 family)